MRTRNYQVGLEARPQKPRPSEVVVSATSPADALIAAEAAYPDLCARFVQSEDGVYGSEVERCESCERPIPVEGYDYGYDPEYGLYFCKKCSAELNEEKGE